MAFCEARSSKRGLGPIDFRTLDKRANKDDIEIAMAWKPPRRLIASLGMGVDHPLADAQLPAVYRSCASWTMDRSTNERVSDLLVPAASPSTAASARGTCASPPSGWSGRLALFLAIMSKGANGTSSGTNSLR